MDLKFNQLIHWSEADPENLHRGGQPDLGHVHVLRGGNKRGKERVYSLRALYKLEHLPTTGGGAMAPLAPPVDPPLLIHCKHFSLIDVNRALIKH